MATDLWVRTAAGALRQPTRLPAQPASPEVRRPALAGSFHACAQASLSSCAVCGRTAPVLRAGANPVVKSARYTRSSGTFTVPGRTVAVFSRTP
ncbi:alpha-1,6-glucosidase domain-containing protein [Streptomyces graminilatus]|uniref:alpha-1,6-glucosidase domain-containing protein n=1 Tax=Streptomyces graminilatus TaxID=1464070 RepID=UPI003BAE5444